jgi:hypothetical protein
LAPFGPRRRSRSVGAHLGLVQRRYQLGEVDCVDGISKCGDRRCGPWQSEGLDFRDRPAVKDAQGSDHSGASPRHHHPRDAGLPTRRHPKRHLPLTHWRTQSAEGGQSLSISRSSRKGGEAYSARQCDGGYFGESGSSRGDPCRGAIRPTVPSRAAIDKVRSTSTAAGPRSELPLDAAPPTNCRKFSLLFSSPLQKCL